MKILTIARPAPWFLLPVVLLGLACASSKQERCQGAERCDCYGNGTCDDGLVCMSNACVVTQGGTGGATTVPGGGGTTAVPGTGGKSSGTGGSGTGGVVALPPPASPNCADVSSASYVLNQLSDSGLVAVAGSDKQYVVQANWWNLKTLNQQSVSVKGLSFTVGNPAGTGSSGNDPLGYPSMFLGSYAGKTSKGSNLPKQVASLTKVNTVFSTNVSSMGTSNYNAAYDVWFTASSSPLPKDQYTPGSGGAYLMVWYFKPADRQPRGRLAYARHAVAGLSGAWDVWIDSTNPPCISYVSSSVIETLDFDLNAFIQDSVGNGYGITSSMYLSLIFAGFEIWGGANGLQAKAFCANVL